MAHSKANLFLALLLLNTAAPAAGGTVMRVKSGGEVEMVHTASAGDLVNMFSDDPEAKSVTANLLTLAEGKPADDLLEFVQKLKQQIQPWHDSAEGTMKKAIEEINACTGSMENGMLGTKPKKARCSDMGDDYIRHREEESTTFTTKEEWKAAKAEKKEIMTTECTIFEKVEEEAKKAASSYSGGDEEAYLEGECTKFSDLLPRFEEAKKQCTTATAEHVTASETYETKVSAWTTKKTESDDIQTKMDETCCEYALSTKDVCTLHETCYQDKVEAYNAQKAIVQAEEKIKKVEWRVYSRIECLLPVLGTDNAAEIEKCRKKTHDTNHLDIDYGKIPQKATCTPEKDFPGSDSYAQKSLPANAKGKAVAKCVGMYTEFESLAVDPKQTLNKCQGDCDEDNECAGSLLCWQRNGDEAGPPGCAGTMKKNWDYCFDPADKQLPAGTLWFESLAVDPKQTLNKCQGDCDNDTQCAGGLKCWQRNGDEAGPPGCAGTMQKDWDYCYDPNQV